MRLCVLHLVGSAASEFLGDLSRLYARDCLEATADPERYDVHVAVITPDGKWRFPSGLTDAELADAPARSLAEAMNQLTDLAPDVVVPQMFCRPGMTAYRALFDVLGIPYVGNPPEAMALGADKAKARAVVTAAGVAVPPGEELRPGERATLAPPVVVKPTDSDNSLGLTLVRREADYPAALAAAWAHSATALVESYVELGREVRCGVVVRDGELVALPLEEYAVDPDTRPIRDHADKIGRGDDGGLTLVAKDTTRAWIVDPDDPITETVQAAARAAHVALGCRDYSLFDFRVDPAGRPWFLEAGLYCSFAAQSVISVMAAAAGIGLPELFADAVAQAIARSDGDA